MTLLSAYENYSFMEARILQWEAFETGRGSAAA